MGKKDVFDKQFDKAPQKLETVKQVYEFHRTTILGQNKYVSHT